MSKGVVIFALPGEISSKLPLYDEKNYVFSSSDGALSYYNSNGNPLLTGTLLGYAVLQSTGDQFLYNLNDEFVFAFNSFGSLLTSYTNENKKKIGKVIVTISSENSADKIIAGDIINVTYYPISSYNSTPLVSLVI